MSKVYKVSSRSVKNIINMIRKQETKMEGNPKKEDLSLLSEFMPELKSDHKFDLESTNNSMIQAFIGNVDSGKTNELVTNFIKNNYEHKLIYTFSSDEYFDYRARRPIASFTYNRISEIDIPKIEIYEVKDNEGNVFYLLSGEEPNFKWEKMSKKIASICKRLNITTLYGVHPIAMPVPHTRDIIVNTHSSETLNHNNYDSWDVDLKFPATISSFLEYKLAKNNVKTVGLAPLIPHYLQSNQYPEAAKAVLSQISEMSGIKIEIDQIEEAVVKTLEKIEKNISDNEEIQAVIYALEEQYDQFKETQASRRELLPTGNIPSGEEIADELEDYLAKINKESNDN